MPESTVLRKEPNKHINFDQRMQFAALLKTNSVTVAGRLMGFSRSTAYNEYKRGLVEQMDSDYRFYKAYDPETAQRKYAENATAKGKPDKLGNRHDFALFISEAIRELRYSPYAALEAWKRTGSDFEVCEKTVYNYIARGWIPDVTMKHLPMKGERKKKYMKTGKARTRNVMQRSITQRPKEINKRGTFGHWELDTVYGTNKKGAVLAVFTERLTRYEIVMKVGSKTAAEIVAAIDEIERQFGAENFRKIFRSITMDNGGEFADDHSIEHSIFNRMQERTTTYYCHPYASSERGSNENQNKLVRRWIAKGERIDPYDESYIAFIQSWMNDMPRKKLKGKTAGDLFAAELAKLGVAERGIGHVA